MELTESQGAIYTTVYTGQVYNGGQSNVQGPM